MKRASASKADVGRFVLDASSESSAKLSIPEDVASHLYQRGMSNALFGLVSHSMNESIAVRTAASE